MESNLNEVEVIVKSLITSSSKKLTINDLVRDYKEAEGKSLPFKIFGFNSVIELLQSMKDIIIPPNPTEHSLITLIVSEKTAHIKSLIDKQKTSTKKKKKNSSINGRLNKFNNHYDNKNINNTSNSSRTFVNNCQINRSHNSFSNYHVQNHRHNTSYTNNQRSQQDLPNNSINPLISSHNGFDRSNSNQNMSSGYVTLDLRLYIERYIFGQHQKVISLTKFKELITSHKDYQLLKLKSISDVKDKFTFLNINEKEVSLITMDQLKKISNEATPLIYQVPGSSKNFSQPSDVENCNKVLHLNDKNQSVEHDSHIRPVSTFLHKNSTSNQNKNSDVAIENLKKNIECVKRQTAMRKIIESRSSNEMKSDCSYFKENGLNNIENDPVNAKICLKRENQCFPLEMLYNISKIFQTYCDGLNVENFEILYAELYHTIFDPISNGFSSTLEMLKVLDLLIEVRNNVLYTKNVKAYSNLYKQIELNDDTILTAQKKIIDHMYTKLNVQISLDVQQQLLNVDGKSKMFLVDAYNPSSFYLKLVHKNVEFDRLVNIMQIFYDKDTTNNLLVQQEHILPGSIYVTSYTTFSTSKQWYRVRVLKEVKFSTTNNVTVIHVDYGTMDIIPKTELRYLKKEFCQLPCQAIHCCLTSYNELDTIPEEVTEAFEDIIDKSPIMVEVDKNYIFDKQYQILHVTLFHTKPDLVNINNELTIWHLNV